MIAAITDLPAHIASRIKVDPATGEWLWDGPVDRDGYGKLNGRGAHRVIYELAVGPVPPKLVLDHAKRLGCSTRHDCVTPWHLEPVTQRVNVLRGTSFAAVNFAKEECVHRHAYDLANTYFYRNRRDCRTCIRDRVARYKRRPREQETTLTLAA